MKAISLWQPWASFIAIGVKPFETRDWAPSPRLIGQRIAIHAAKKTIDADNREWAARNGAIDLPLGAVICTGILAGAYRCGQMRQDGRLRQIGTVPGSQPHLGIPPDEFGDYEVGRWAWWLTNIERFEPAIPARGAQGFWNWND
jgi:activating signal cointegrator 1